jgi:hypothetical protein
MKHISALKEYPFMNSTHIRRTSLFALAFAAFLAPLGCIADVDSPETDVNDEMEMEEVGSAEQAITVSDLAYRIVTIRNGYLCPVDYRCGMHLSWGSDGSVKLYPKDNTADLVPWRLVPVPGKSDEFYMRNEWSCPSDSRCDQHLSWNNSLDAKLYPRDNTSDLVPWKFIPVPGTTNKFYIRNQWNCPWETRCNKHLSWAPDYRAALYPEDNTADLVPWEITAAPALSDRLSAHFRDPNAPRPTISYGRGAGSTPGTCPGGYEMDAGLCYPNCAGGYDGVGPMCWQFCPSGYTDFGATCTYAGPVTVDCTWNGFNCSCPANYSASGLWCTVNTITKGSYGRGAGNTPSCPPHQEADGGLCYSKCDPGYEGVASECVVNSFTGLCAGLYDPTLARAAVAQAKGLTFGIGAGIASGHSLGAETGMAYGEHGEFGCYTQTCEGAVTNISINAWTSFGVMNKFADVDGTSTVVSAGASAGIVGAGVGTVWSGPEYQGTQASLSLGAGLIPVELGVQNCNATLTRIW